MQVLLRLDVSQVLVQLYVPLLENTHHLDGVLYIDRMQGRSFMTNENFERHWKDKAIAEVQQELGIELEDAHSPTPPLPPPTDAAPPQTDPDSES